MRRQQDAPGIAGDVIRLDEVTKAYQAGAPPALSAVSMSVRSGEVAAIMGPSGSGKSTLLNLIAGLDRPSAGTVTVAGQRIDTLGEGALARFRARHIGIIFQFFNLLDDLTVSDNVLLPAQLAGASRRQARARAWELLARLGIDKQRDAYPARLSGGQRQRVAIARALVNAPELLLADEPTGALDTATGEEIGRLLGELNTAGQTLVLVTHDPALAARHAARTITIVDGRVAGGARGGGPGGDGPDGCGGLVMTATGGARTRWFSVIRTASGGMLRHKVASAVIGMVLLVSTASATLGLALLAASSGPFDHAFSAQRGAQLAVTVNSAVTTKAELTAAGKIAGVTAFAGPFPEAAVQFVQQGQPFGQYTLAGRSAPGGTVDDLVLNAGHWADGPGQVVLNGSAAYNPDVGSTLTVAGVPGSPVLTIVGYANSITGTADGWVTPAEATRLQAALRSAGQPGSAQAPGPGGTGSSTGTQDQLLFRFANGGSSAQLHADLGAVTRALPRGAVADSQSWLTARQNATGNGAIMEPFVVAFALIGLVMAVLIVGNVVSGAVVAQYQRIGVLKSIGMTPGQVVAVYLSRIGWPALGGCLLGVLAGNALAIPVLRQSSDAYSVGGQQVPWWASVIAPAGLLLLTLLAALGPALRAGRLPAVKAIADGRAPGGRTGYAVHRLAGRLPLPRPVSLGLAAPFARPARTAVTLAALAFGATAVIFAVGLQSSLSRAAAAQNLTATAPVQIQQNGSGNGPQQATPGDGSPQAPSAAQFAAMTALLRAQPGTAHLVTVYGTMTSGAGIGQNLHVQAFDGNAAWIGYALIAGHWYSRAGEVDVNTAFLTQSGLAVGDSTTLKIGSAQVPVRIAGEVFQPSRNPRVYGSTRTLPGLVSPENFDEAFVGLKPGVSVTGYVDVVNPALTSTLPFIATTEDGGQFYVIAIALIGLLSLMVAVASALGVLNTVLMSTRDKVHDLGIFKTLGMRPGQLVVMVMCWVVAPGIVAGAIAAPAAIALNTATLRAMGGTADTGIPASFTQVFPDVRLALLSLAALGIAVLGALLPAAWAARTRPATALRAE